MSPTALRVLSLESRRQQEMSDLLHRHGAQGCVAPSLREIPLEDNQSIFDFAERLLAGQVDVMIFLTGVGARAMMSALETRFTRADVLAALDRCRVVVRGPKPIAVLHEWNLRIDIKAPTPNTWRELIQALDDNSEPLDSRTVAVQEYGAQNGDLHGALRQRGAEVLPVTVYRWALPEDCEPLETAVRRTIAGDFDVLMITSAQQFRHAGLVAEQLGCRDEFLAAVKKCLIASIGPTSSEALREYGLEAAFEPSLPKMGALVREACRELPGRLQPPASQ